MGINFKDEELFEIMMKNIGKEVLTKSKQANSIEELLVLAKENNIELTVEQARHLLAELNPKPTEFTDEELSNVAGGAGYSTGVIDKSGSGGYS